MHFISKERKFSSVSGTGVQYIPGHEEQFVDFIIDSFVQPAYSILELGGGGLRFALPVARLGKKITVVDLDESGLNTSEIIDKVNENNKELYSKTDVIPKIITVVDDVMKYLTYSSTTFDLIASFRTVHFFTPTQMEAFFEETHKKLNSKGVLVFSCITPYEFSDEQTTNEIYNNSDSINGNQLHRKFKNTDSAKKIRVDQNLAETMHFVTSSSVYEMATKNGFDCIELNKQSTKVVSGFVLRKC